MPMLVKSDLTTVKYKAAQKYVSQRKAIKQSSLTNKFSFIRSLASLFSSTCDGNIGLHLRCNLKLIVCNRFDECSL
jgi:hypothetical protein